MNFLILTISFTVFVPYLGTTLECYFCNQGYHTQTPCTRVGQPAHGLTKSCSGRNQACVQSIEWFQNGSLQLVKRDCLNGDYCKNFKNKVGDLKQCKTCKTDLCNGDTIYEPLPTKCQ